MYYKNDLGYNYPEKPDEHMITIKGKRKITLDKSYPYFNRRLGFKLLRGVYFILLNLIIFPMCRITHGLRIYGKKNLKKYKKELKGGAITISNHVFFFDYLCVSRVIRPHLPFVPTWKDNVEGSAGAFLRLAGAIPIPNDSARAMIEFNRAVEDVIKSGKWLHFFPEGSMWFFYPDLRPFKKGVFHYAVRFDKPIIPMAFSFRPRRGITKLFSKKPFADLHVGEPIFPDKTLPPREAEKVMAEKAHLVMSEMMDIPKE
jgi:1-acyl-sn-glycerol-3-phosphate acyltransferase